MSFHHSYVLMRLQRKLQIGCLPRHAFAWVPRQIHELARKHMICSQARGLQTMICLQLDQQGLQGLQTYDMFASMWLTKISYICKPYKIIPFLSVGATAMRVAGNKEGNGEGSKGDEDSDKGVRQGTAFVTKWAMTTAMRVAGKEESKHSMGYGSDDKVAGK